jgi:hypothetical protein
MVNLETSFGSGLLFTVIYIVVSSLIFLLILRIWYSVIWRAVCRQIKEFHLDNPGAPTS